MRAIDADALEELFREVIGRISKRPDINFNMEHMIRASAMVIEMIKDAPTIQPEIICCKDCVKHNKGIGDIEEQPYGLRKHIMKDEACPLVSWRGKAQGHEFDYQFCVYGKRREVTT